MRIWGRISQKVTTLAEWLAQCHFNAPNYVEFAQVNGASGTAHIFTTWLLHFATANRFSCKNVIINTKVWTICCLTSMFSFIFKTQSYYVFQAGFKLTTLLSWLKHHHASTFFFHFRYRYTRTITQIKDQCDRLYSILLYSEKYGLYYFNVLLPDI